MIFNVKWTFEKSRLVFRVLFYGKISSYHKPNNNELGSRNKETKLHDKIAERRNYEIELQNSKATFCP